MAISLIAHYHMSWLASALLFDSGCHKSTLQNGMEFRAIQLRRSVLFRSELRRSVRFHLQHRLSDIMHHTSECIIDRPGGLPEGVSSTSDPLAPSSQNDSPTLGHLVALPGLLVTYHDRTDDSAHCAANIHAGSGGNAPVHDLLRASPITHGMLEYIT